MTDFILIMSCGKQHCEANAVLLGSVFCKSIYQKKLYIMLLQLYFTNLQLDIQQIAFLQGQNERTMPTLKEIRW